MQWRVEPRREGYDLFLRPGFTLVFTNPLNLVVGYPKQISRARVANERNIWSRDRLRVGSVYLRIDKPSKAAVNPMHQWAAPLQPRHSQPTCALSSRDRPRSLFQACLHTIVRASVDPREFPALGRTQPSPNRPDPHKRADDWTEESLSNLTRSTLLSAVLPLFPLQRRRSPESVSRHSSQ
jgi:hypothetical protein